MTNGSQLPTNQLHGINWGALDRASCAPQLMSCNYYVCVCVWGGVWYDVGQVKSSPLLGLSCTFELLGTGNVNV